MADPTRLPLVHVPPPCEREQRAAASRYVLRQARDREDLRLLLDALGLNTPKEGTNA